MAINSFPDSSSNVASAKVFYRGTIGTSLSTIYTVPSNKKNIITDVLIVNNTSYSQTVSAYLDGVVFLPSAIIEASSVINYTINQVLETGQTISAISTSSSIAAHISGMEG